MNVMMRMGQQAFVGLGMKAHVPRVRFAARSRG
jgi:hypothetical protein